MNTENKNGRNFQGDHFAQDLHFNLLCNVEHNLLDWRSMPQSESFPNNNNNSNTNNCTKMIYFRYFVGAASKDNMPDSNHICLKLDDVMQ